MAVLMNTVGDLNNPNIILKTKKDKHGNIIRTYATRKKVYASLPTGKKLDAAVKKWRTKYKQEAKSCDQTNQAIKDQQKVIDKANDFLDKTNGYHTVNDAYQAAAKNVTDLKAKLKKATKKNKKDIEKKLKAAIKTQKSAYKDLVKVKKSPAAQKQFDAMRKAKAKVAQLKRSLSAKKTHKNNVKTYYQKLKAKQSKAKAKAELKKRKKNQAAIDAKIKAQRKKKLAPTTALWRADQKTASVVFLGEISPNEDNSADGPSNAVDNADPRTNYNVRTAKQLSGTYYLFATGGTTNETRWANIDKHFDSLQKWQLWGLELRIRGFSKLKHIYITDINKVSENKDQNALQLSITFSYKKPAYLAYRQKKSKKNSKGEAVKVTGAVRKAFPKANKTHTLRAYDTLSRVAKEYHTTIGELAAKNKNITFSGTIKGKKVKI